MNTKYAPSSQIRIKQAVFTLSIAALVVLSACGNKEDGKTAGQKLDSAVANTEQAAAEAKAKAEAAMARAGDAIKDATQKAESSSGKVVQSMSGKAGDATITASVLSELAKDANLSAAKIDVDTKDGKVTLTGPAPTAAARDKAGALAKSIKGVTSVSNKLTVKPS